MMCSNQLTEQSDIRVPAEKNDDVSVSHSVLILCSAMVVPSNIVCSVLFCLLVVSAHSTSVVTCMLCTVITDPLDSNMTPTAMVNAMFKKCDQMGLMEPICEQFVSENVKDVFQRVRKGIAPAKVCESMGYCDS